jgi:magnesium-transporting ATPase (P-type)
MTWKSTLQQIGLMTVIMFGVWSFTSGLLRGLMGFIDPSAFGLDQALAPLPGLFGTCLLNVLVIVWFVSKSRLSGFKLALVVFTIIFGVMFFMTQIETIYFNNSIQMPWQIIFSTVLTGVLVGLVVSWLSVRYKKNILATQQANTPPDSKHIFLPGIFWKFGVLSVIYLVFYFLFGYFIAWQFPAIREYYTGSTNVLPFFTHMHQQIVTDPWLILFQIFRGLLWAGIAYVVVVNIDMGQAKQWERMVLAGLALSIGLATPLFIPNEYMPGAVRFGHFFEVLIENFLFGVIATILFQQNPDLVVSLVRVGGSSMP